MKDKMLTIRATAELQHSILGHGTRTDADNYGEGDEIVVFSIDRLARNLRDLEDIIIEVNSKGVS